MRSSIAVHMRSSKRVRQIEIHMPIWHSPEAGSDDDPSLMLVGLADDDAASVLVAGGGLFAKLPRSQVICSVVNGGGLLIAMKTSPPEF